MAEPDPQQQIASLHAKVRDLQATVVFLGAELKAVRALLVRACTDQGMKGPGGQPIDQVLAKLTEDGAALAAALRRLLALGQSAADERREWKEGQ
jgi:hypothetical protein